MNHTCYLSCLSSGKSTTGHISRTQLKGNVIRTSNELNSELNGANELFIKIICFNILFSNFTLQTAMIRYKTVVVTFYLNDE